MKRLQQPTSHPAVTRSCRPDPSDFLWDQSSVNCRWETGFDIHVIVKQNKKIAELTALQYVYFGFFTLLFHSKKGLWEILLPRKKKKSKNLWIWATQIKKKAFQRLIFLTYFNFLSVLTSVFDHSDIFTSPCTAVYEVSLDAHIMNLASSLTGLL